MQLYFHVVNLRNLNRCYYVEKCRLSKWRTPHFSGILNFWYLRHVLQTLSMCLFSIRYLPLVWSLASVVKFLCNKNDISIVWLFAILWLLIMVKYQQNCTKLTLLLNCHLHQNALSFPVLTQCCSSRGLIQMQYKRCFINIYFWQLFDWKSGEISTYLFLCY